MKNKRLFLLLALPLIAFNACNKRDPEPASEQELITTVKLTFMGNAGNQEFIFRDDRTTGGKQAAKLDTIRLNNQSTYHIMVSLMDESKSQAEDISEEVEEASDEHQLFYSSTPSGLVGVQYADKDTKNMPLGLEAYVTTVSTTNDKNAKFRVILRHKPNKAAAGVKEGNIENAGGDTDVDVSFPIIIQ